MAIPTTRQEFVDWCLRRLGYPVININTDSTQLDDRVDEALQVWQEKHYDGSERVWVSYPLTNTDIANGYITLPSDILIVDCILPLSTIYNPNNMDSVFNYKYQFVMSNLSPFKPISLINYYLTMENINEVNFMLNQRERFEFTKHKNKLMIYAHLSDFNEGDVFCFHVCKAIDPVANPDVWNDKWLKEYTCALFKMQFGTNMKKHGEIQLLGGVTVNGQQWYDEAVQDIERLQEQLQSTYMEPPMFIVG